MMTSSRETTTAIRREGFRVRWAAASVSSSIVVGRSLTSSRTRLMKDEREELVHVFMRRSSLILASTDGSRYRGEDELGAFDRG